MGRSFKLVLKMGTMPRGVRVKQGKLEGRGLASRERGKNLSR
jgi:hypothetical protein